MTSTAPPPNDITAILNYTEDNGTTPWIYDRPLTKQDQHKSAFYVPVDPVTVTVHDGRAREDLTVHNTSFQLVDQVTSLSPEDFYDNPNNIIESTYYPEMEAFLAQQLGAAKVVVFNHQVRNEVKSGSGGVGAYAKGIHIDFATAWADQTFSSVTRGRLSEDEVTRLSKGRYVLLNAWRNISHQPIQQDALAVCDETTVVKPDDYIPSNFYGKASGGKQYHLSSRNASKHKWYYFPQMTRDEVLLIKQYDSDSTQLARSCFHTAFTDPTSPADAPTRESIEIRALALFPDHEPNTCPPLSEATNDALQQGSVVSAPEAANRIRSTVDSLFFFPLPVQWLYRYTMRSGQDSAPSLIRLFMSDRGNRLGLERASDSIKAEATAILLRDDAFATRALVMKRRLEQAIAARRRQSPWFWWLSPYNW